MSIQKKNSDISCMSEALSGFSKIALLRLRELPKQVLKLALNQENRIN